MYLFGAVMLLIWLILIPLFMGLPFAGLGLEREKKLSTAIICGYMEMWALFQVIAVMFVLTTNDFDHVVYTFGIVSIAMAVIAFVWAHSREKAHAIDKSIREQRCMPWRLDNKKERMEFHTSLFVYYIICFPNGFCH